MKFRTTWFAIAIAAALPAAGCTTDVYFVRDDGGVRKIYRMQSDGSSQQRVAPADTLTYLNPALSPDGQKVAYTDGEKIFVSDLGDIGGASQIELSTQSGRKTSLRWTPSQLAVGYAQFSPSNHASLWLAAASGVNSLQITFPTGSQSDGGGLTFYLGQNSVQNVVYSRDGRLYTMFFNGTQPATPITSGGPTIRHTLPTVSHDNSLLAFRVSVQLAPTGTTDSIQLYEVGTWAPRNAIVLPGTAVKQGSISSIAFSCDDERLYVAADAAAGSGSPREIFSVKLDGSDLQRLTDNTVLDTQPESQPPPCR